ncbi:MAG: DNA (cytosine-5-)-methyltransferase [Candidatus Portnoybacteria bacterium RBG_13_40_8]|uniref:Cytosine-specific methyltransferase n=1 Tax=Candidatus Portnoybacteria bacterium RBG_13_40_8 TaxID=1801990 RepID=A0A1G2F4A5_9BACT|nr:MAG: DNA (cytosine-5-)-methyltransferase [Candidatus Portnoybacteria bacterium RBG_13_40_8]
MIKKFPKKFAFIDLFAGIGGIRLGFEKAGYKCVFSSEIDRECQLTYRLNFNEFPRGDITKIKSEEIPAHSILTAGFPCQAFSICGRQRGFNDTRGTLFFEILRIAKAKKPDVIFLENVKHLKYHDDKKTLSIIINNLEKIGYKVSWDILNAKDFGVAQNRERIIIIGHKKKKFDFSKINKKRPVSLKKILEKKGKFEYLQLNEYTLLKNIKRQPSGLIFAGYRNKKIRENGTRPNTIHLSRVHKQPNRIYSSEGVHPTLPSQETAGRFFVLHDNKVRKLTIEECFRLMGFPKEFKKYSRNGNLYKQIGNSVVVPMVAELAYQIKNQFLK